MLLLLLLAAALVVVALLLWSLILRAGDTAAAVAQLREELKGLTDRLALQEVLAPTPRHFEGPLNVEEEPVLLTQEELLTLGRSIVLQIYRGERTVATLSRAEERAVKAFRLVAGDDAPKGVPMARRGL